MSESAQKLAELKSYLERRIEELKKELELLEATVKLVDAALSSASFVKASELATRQVQPAVPAKHAEPLPQKQEAPLSEMIITARATGEKLARVIVYPTRVEVSFLKSFSASTPPFESFFVRKVLEGYKKKDEDLILKGEKRPEDSFDYLIEEEGGNLKRIVITNYGDRRVAEEIKNTLRWTLNRMHEKA